MKIALLTPFYPSTILPKVLSEKYKLKTGHPYTWITNLAEGLSKIENNDVHVVTFNSEFDTDYEYKNNGVTYNFLQNSGRLNRYCTLFESDSKKIGNYLENNQFDIIHGQGMNIYGYFAVSSKISHVLTVHLHIRNMAEAFQLSYNHNFKNIYFGLLSAKYNYFISKYAKNIISISPFINNEFENIKNEKNIYLIENAISKSFFEVTDTSDQSFALFIGTIDDRKSVIELIEAVHRVGNVYLKIISTTNNGKYYENVLELIRHYNLNNRVEFLGAKKNNELADIMKDCSYVVLPSKKEGAPMVISEAMAVGKPVIASNVDGIPYMIRDSETGFLIDPSNTDQLAEKISILSSNKGLREKMGRQAKGEAKSRWHPDVIAHKTMEVYERILSANGGN